MSLTVILTAQQSQENVCISEKNPSNVALARSSECAGTFIQPSHKENDNQPFQMEGNWEEVKPVSEARQPSPRPERHQLNASIQTHSQRWHNQASRLGASLTRRPHHSDDGAFLIWLSICIRVHVVETAHLWLFLDDFKWNASECHELRLHKKNWKVWIPSQTSPSPLSG